MSLGHDVPAGLPLSRIGGSDGRTLAHVPGVALAVVAWLPLLALSLAQGKAWGWRGAFAEDLGTHVRFLLGIPLMWEMRRGFDQRVQDALTYLREANLVDGDTWRRIDASVSPLIGTKGKARYYVAALVLGYLMSGGGRYLLDPRAFGTWQTLQGGATSLAGYWRGLVSLPIANAVLVFCAMRVLAWVVILLRSVRHLKPVPTHPDRYSGLFVLVRVAGDFTPLLATVSTVFASILWTQLHRGTATMDEVRHTALAFVLTVPSLLLVPLVLFAVPLANARREALRTYGVAVTRVSRAFQAKLRVLQSDPRVTMDGDAFSWDADMGGSFERVTQSHVVPIPRVAVVLLVSATLAPMLALMFAELPAAEALAALGRFKELIF